MSTCALIREESCARVGGASRWAPFGKKTWLFRVRAFSWGTAMAGALQLGGQCPLCRETGRDGKLELRQINACEALWICGNMKVCCNSPNVYLYDSSFFLQCPYPLYLDVLTVSSIVPELLPPDSGSIQSQTATGDHSGQNMTTGNRCGRNVAASADQSDEMAAAASSPNNSQDTGPNFGKLSYQHNSLRFGNNSTYSPVPGGTFSGQEWTTQMYPSPSFSAHPTNTAFGLTPLEPGNVLDELSAMFKDKTS